MSQKPVILEGESKVKRRRERRRGEMTVAFREAATVPVHERGVHTSDGQSG